MSYILIVSFQLKDAASWRTDQIFEAKSFGIRVHSPCQQCCWSHVEYFKSRNWYLFPVLYLCNKYHNTYFLFWWNWNEIAHTKYTINPKVLHKRSLHGPFLIHFMSHRNIFFLQFFTNWPINRPRVFLEHSLILSQFPWPQYQVRGRISCQPDKSSTFLLLPSFLSHSPRSQIPVRAMRFFRALQTNGIAVQLQCPTPTVSLCLTKKPGLLPIPGSKSSL